MTGPRTIVTPVACRGRAVELAADVKGRRRWRKQILPVGELEVDGQKLRFDEPYLRGVAKAYSDRAVDHVPLQLATGSNAHNNDPELTRGLIDGVGMHQPGEKPGLYASVVTGERGSALLDEFPEIGVSVRLIEDLDNAAQGKTYPWALQHVLATWDPRITGMTGWSPDPTDLARTGARVVDLSRTRYRDLTATSREGAPVAPTQDDITQAVQEGVAAALAKLGHTEQQPPADDTGGATEPWTVPTDAELEALAEQYFGDLTDTVDAPNGDGDGEGDDAPEDDDADTDSRQLIEASARHSRELELANQRADDAQIGLRDMAARMDGDAWKVERQRWIDQGIPPRCVDLARGACEGSGKTIELSSGDRYDVGAAIREIFTTLVKTGGLVDLSRSVGTGHDGSDAHGDQSEVDRLAASLIDGL